MTIDINQMLEWLIIAALAGGLVGLLVKRKKEGFGRFQNVLIGLVGTLIGVGAIRLLKHFNVLKTDIITGEITLRWQELAASCIGALLFLTVMHFLRKKKA